MTREEAKQFGISLLKGIAERNTGEYAENVRLAIAALTEPLLSSNIERSQKNVNMTRAEQLALEAYPYDYPERTGFRQGYEQAEKDLVLTWEDMAKIDAIILDVNNEFAVDYTKEIDRQKFYEEILKRFKNLKNK